MLYLDCDRGNALTPHLWDYRCKGFQFSDTGSLNGNNPPHMNWVVRARRWSLNRPTFVSLLPNNSSIILRDWDYVRGFPLSGGRDSSVGIATRYGLDGPGIGSRCEARFFAPVQTGPGVHPASCTMGTGSFPGVKRSGRGVDHPPPFSAEVEGRVELYICSPLWAFVACSRESFT